MPDAEPPIGRLAWYATVRAHARVFDALEREVEAATGMPMAWYDVLVNLYLAPGHAMRMSELADRVIMSRSWLTRRVDQLVAAGLVERCSSVDGDGRGVRARLTREGRRAFVRMERVHARMVDELVARHLSPSDARVIARAMERVGGGAAGPAPTAGPR
jgi:DNA-binding MarR family transcriptional regulator